MMRSLTQTHCGKSRHKKRKTIGNERDPKPRGRVREKIKGRQQTLRACALIFEGKQREAVTHTDGQ